MLTNLSLNCDEIVHKFRIFHSKKVSVILRVCVFGLDNPVSSEDRSPATETGNTSDYSQLNMASLSANVPYESIQPTYSEVR